MKISNPHFKMVAVLFFSISGLNAGLYAHNPMPLNAGAAVAIFGLGIVWTSL